MTTKTDELKPCPFCGGEAVLNKHMSESLWSHDVVEWTHVSCNECEAQVAQTCEGYEVEAIDVWNRRAALQSQDREDSARQDWIEAIHGCEIIEFADGTWEVDVSDGPFGIGKGMREAIDHARRVEGGGQ